MASVRLRSHIYHIEYMDPVEKRKKSITTGLTESRANEIQAKKEAKKLQEEIYLHYKKLKAIGIETITIDDAFQHFLRNNQGKDYKTIRDYHRFYNKFIETFHPDIQCSSLTKSNIEDWFNTIKKLPYAKNTIHGYGKQCIHFMNFCFEYNYTPMFKVNREVKTRAEIKEKIVFTDEDFLKIILGLNKKNTNFKAAILLHALSGLRPSDILNIKVEGLNVEQRTIYFYSPKAKKYREIPFHRSLTNVLRKRVEEIKEGYLIRYAKTEGEGKAFSDYLNKLKLDGKSYTLRTFRKTFITWCRTKYHQDASVVRELVGQKHSNVADKYYNEIGIRAMQEVLNNFKTPRIKTPKRVK